jgi:hypothetical protein
VLAIEALRRYTPGCAGVRLRNFGMTIGRYVHVPYRAMLPRG